MRNHEDDIGPLESPPERLWHLLMVLAVLMMAFIMVAASAWLSEAEAHDFYDAVCCNGNSMSGDCQEVPASTVRPIMGGYQITLNPGNHRLVTRIHVFQIEQSKVRPSPDGQYHVCLYPTEDHLQCFYAPPPGA